MPFDQYTTPGEQQRREKKNVQQAQQQGQAANPPSSTPPNYTTQYDSVTTVDKASRATLPTSSVMYLAGLSPDQKELARLGRIFAQNFSIAPKYVFGKTKPGDYTSPITGQPLSIQEARQFSNDFGAVPVASMLQDILKQQTVVPGTVAGGLAQQQNIQTTNIDPVVVGKLARILADEGPDMKFEQAMGIAVTLAQKGVTPATFRKNFDLTNQWFALGPHDTSVVTPGTTPGGLAQKPNVKPHSTDIQLPVRYAVAITASGTRLKSVNDVAKLVVGAGPVAASNKLNNLIKGIHSTQLPSGTAYVTDYMPNVAFPSRQAATQAVTMSFSNDTLTAGGGVDVGILPETIVGPDYWSQVMDAQGAIRADQAAFQNSWVGKAIHDGGVAIGAVTGPLNVPYRHVMSAAVLAMRYPIAVTAEAIRPLWNPNHYAANQLWDTITAAGRFQASRISTQQATPGQLITEPLGPKYQWVAMPLDFFIQWEADPLVQAGKFKEASVATRVAPGTLDSGQLAQKLEGVLAKLPDPLKFINQTSDARSVAQWTGKWDKFAGSRESMSLLRSKNEAQLLEKLGRLKGSIEGRTLLDPAYTQRLWQLVHEAHTSMDAGAIQDWKDGIKVFGALGQQDAAPLGSIADRALRDRLGLGDAAANDAAAAAAPVRDPGLPLTDSAGNPFSPTVDQSVMASQLGVEPVHLPMGYFSREVPRSLLPEWGPRRAIRALSDKASTIPGLSNVSGLPVQNTGRFLDLNGIGDRAPDIYAYNTARRAGLSEELSRGFQAKINDALNTPRPEVAVEKAITDIQDQYWGQYMSQLNVDPVLADQMKSDFFGKSAGQADMTRTQAFGVSPDYGPENPFGFQTGPQLETQLRNKLYVADPIEVKAAVRDYVSYRDRIWNTLRSAVGQDPALVAGSIGDKKAFASIIDKGGEAYKAWLRGWKAATILRPGYFAKVILLDENLKQMTMFSSLTDRLMSLGWGYRAGAPEGGVFSRTLGNVADKALTPVRNALQSSFAQRIGDLVDENGNPITVLSASAHEYQYGVMGTGRTSDLVSQVYNGKADLTKAMESDGGWDPLIVDSTSTPNEVANHMKSWTWDLSMQMGQSVPGRIALDSVQKGETIQQTKEALAAWAAKDHYSMLFQRIGIEPKNLDNWLSSTAETAHAYTMDSKDAAQLALLGDRSGLADFLGKVPVDERPWIHGPSVAQMVDKNWVTNTVDKGFGLFVQSGHDAWSWQPAFTEWKRRAEISSYKALENAGTKVVSSEMGRAIDKGATDFALGQVRRTMLDLTRQSRFSELIRLAFPFPQPFFQGFETWGHLAFRNPVAMVHAAQLFHIGEQSGFFKKDPVSGAYEVSMGIYRPLLQLFAGHVPGGNPDLMKHLDSPWMPLSSFNLALSAKLTPGGQGIIGKTIGGVSIPVPGANPVAQAAMQWAFKDSTDPAATGYLFQFGPNISWLPSPVKAVAQVLFPQDFQDSTEKQTLALSITEALHRFGQDRDANGNLIPLNQTELAKMQSANLTPGVGPHGETTLAQIANDQATALMEARGLTNLFTPTAGRIAFEGQRSDQAAFDSMLAINGNDYKKALDEWYQKFPNSPFIPVGKTLAVNPQGETQYPGAANVRVPASELTYRMLRIPGVGEFMSHNPAWAALLLVGTDPSLQDQQSFATFADELNKGFLKYKTPDQYYQSASDAAGWAQYSRLSTALYAPAIDKAVRENHGSYTAATQSLAWNSVTDARQQMFDQIYRDNPHWVLDHLSYNADFHTWDWPSTNGAKDPVALTNAAAARGTAQGIIDNPQLAQFPGVIALKSYMDKTAKLKQQMNNHQIYDVTNDASIAAGYWKKYQNIVRDTITQQPDIQPFLSNLFGIRTVDTGTAPLAQPGTTPTAGTIKVEDTNDLVDNISQSRAAWLNLAASDQMRHSVLHYANELSNLKHDASTLPIDTFDRTTLYHKVDTLQQRVWAANPKILKSWYNTLGTTAKQDYHNYLGVKPVQYFTPFDFHVAGIQMSPGVQKQWDKISQTYYDIAKYKNENPTWSSGQGYDQLNAAVSKLLQAKSTPQSLKQAITAENTWGWGVDHVLGYGVPEKTVDKNGKPLTGKNLLAFGNYRSKADWQWAQFLDAMRKTQAAVVASGSHGLSTFDAANLVNSYKGAQDAAKAAVKDYEKDPGFKQMWQDLTSLNGGVPLIGSMFLPDTYFGPLGYWKNGNGY